jgi:type IV secretory pathway protease TraF
MTGQLRANWNRHIRSRVGGTFSLLVLAFGGGLLGLARAASWVGLRYNDSPSMPTGLYIRASSESRSSLAVFCPEERTARLSAERGYRSFDSRYFGPVKASQVREHVRPLLTAR